MGNLDSASSFRIVSTPSPIECEKGAELVAYVAQQSNSGYPDMYAEGKLAGFITHRQNHAHSIILAVQSDGNIIGHMLVEYANGPEWASWALTQPAWADSHLLEIGGGAVHPDYQRQGIATALMRIALAIACKKGDVIVASAWTNGISEKVLLEEPQWLRIGEHQPVNTGRVTTFLYLPSIEESSPSN